VLPQRDAYTIFHFVDIGLDKVKVWVYFAAMQREVISTCPVCESELHVTRLHCNTCGTTIEGEFNVGRFAHLGRDQMLLLEGFLRSRGNLRELERELGVSYPTVRGRVENLLRALGLSDGSPLPPAPPEAEATGSAAVTVDATTRRSVLERLARKEITADEAASLLRGEQAEATAETQAETQTQPTAGPEQEASASDADPDEDTTITQPES